MCLRHTRLVGAFDPNSKSESDTGIFGLRCDEHSAAVVLLPVPWEVTTSYGGWTSQGPTSILRASHQVDVYDDEIRNPYEAGITMLAECEKIQQSNRECKALAEKMRLDGDAHLTDRHQILALINKASAELNTL
jgi:agmatinase